MSISVYLYKYSVNKLKIYLYKFTIIITTSRQHKGKTNHISPIVFAMGLVGGNFLADLSIT